MLNGKQHQPPTFVETVLNLTDSEQRRQIVFIDGTQTVTGLLQAIATKTDRNDKQQCGQQRPEPQALGNSDRVEHKQR